MNQENRRPIIIAIVCAVIAIAVLVFGVSCGGGNNAAAKDWQGFFSGAGKGGRITVADLAVNGGSCSASAAQLVVAGSCTFGIKEFGGLFNFGPPTKRARLRPLQPVTVSLLVEGTKTQQDATVGDSVDLTFGTSGGQFTVVCRTVGNCVIQLLDAGG
ncbi:hypothetical protein [Arthrobacter sp. M4]|uniref:hypothetical protein n=1 Tax=Arthrobacter sp. M4 TaxID=218160 RepID=UPI001CDBF15A|nr:hypothetical protein [Arthrobacter sp. M4]MCA4135432.1 hypothetical protein [Arthrobacter sp. M4]